MIATLTTHSGTTHLVCEVLEVIPNGYVADPATSELTRSRNACGRAYTGTTTTVDADLDGVTCARCAAAVAIMRERAAKLDALPTDDVEPGGIVSVSTNGDGDLVIGVRDDRPAAEPLLTPADAALELAAQRGERAQCTACRYYSGHTSWCPNRDAVAGAR